jgi:hypothetical protein
MTITLTGYNDDLISLEGDIREEFYLSSDGIGDLLTFSPGLVARINYTEDGVWRIQVLAAAADIDWSLTQCAINDEDDYSDILVINERIKWVVCGNRIELPFCLDPDPDVPLSY